MAWTRTHPIGSLVSILVLLAILPTHAHADWTNGSFESSDSTGWFWGTTGGFGGVVNVLGTHTSATGTPPLSWSPTDGARFALLTPPTTGHEKTTYLYQSFVASAADDVLAFDYFWDREAGPQSAQGSIRSGTGPSGSQVGSSLFSFTSSNPDGAWASYSGSIASLGLSVGSTYTLLFEITNDKATPVSHLGLDNVRWASSEPPIPTPIPLPGSALLSALGLCVMGLKARWRKPG
jgi:hypothetical protein